MRRKVTLAVALVLAGIGLLGFATKDFVAIGCVILVISCVVLAVTLGVGAAEDDK